MEMYYFQLELLMDSAKTEEDIICMLNACLEVHLELKLDEYDMFIPICFTID